MSDNGIVEGKVVVVTGAGGGIGREIALLMARCGAHVVVNDLGASVGGEGTDQAPADKVVEEITETGARAIANYDTVAEYESARNIVETAVETFGRIDAVVNNAGILRDRIFHKMTPEEWHAVIDVHLNGAFNVSHAAAQHFRAQESGSFVHFTSASGLIGNYGQANYAAAKMGITALSKALALDLSRFNVNSNCISPTAWSRMTESIPASPEYEERLARARLATPEKIAPLAVFLISDRAKEVTGQIFGIRRNEVFLFSQPRPVRSLHRSTGWTPEALADQMLPAFRTDFYPLERSSDVFSWEPQ
jgi:NAD(P)-dependent dehydrogenase (short-subunit alcohol dehydrogenase family)